MNLAAMRESAAHWRETGRLTADRQVDEIVDRQFTEYAIQLLGPYQ